MANSKNSIFFLVFSLVSLLLITYIASISYQMTQIDAIIFRILIFITLTVMMIGAYGTIGVIYDYLYNTEKTEETI